MTHNGKMINHDQTSITRIWIPKNMRINVIFDKKGHAKNVKMMEIGAWSTKHKLISPIGTRIYNLHKNRNRERMASTTEDCCSRPCQGPMSYAWKYQITNHQENLKIPSHVRAPSELVRPLLRKIYWKRFQGWLLSWSQFLVAAGVDRGILKEEQPPEEHWQLPSKCQGLWPWLGCRGRFRSSSADWLEVMLQMRLHNFFLENCQHECQHRK